MLWDPRTSAPSRSSPAFSGAVRAIGKFVKSANSVPQYTHYVDPAKGYAFDRSELFNLPADVQSAPENIQERQTIRMDNFHQSPHGFWYPTVVQDTTRVMRQFPATISRAKARSSNSNERFATTSTSMSSCRIRSLLSMDRRCRNSSTIALGTVLIHAFDE